MEKILFILVALLLVTITETNGFIISMGIHASDLSFWDLIILGSIQFIVMLFIQKVVYKSNKSRDNKIAIIYAAVVISFIILLFLMMITLNLLICYITATLFIILFSMSLVLFFDSNKIQSDKIIFIVLDCIFLVIFSVTVLELHFELLIANTIGIIFGLFSYYFWKWLSNIIRKIKTEV